MFSFQTFLGILDKNNCLSKKLKSGHESLQRPTSKSIQTFQEKTTELPLKKPIPKVTSLLQVRKLKMNLFHSYFC